MRGRQINNSRNETEEIITDPAGTERGNKEVLQTAVHTQI